jgi:hypothetical protein
VAQEAERLLCKRETPVTTATKAFKNPGLQGIVIHKEGGNLSI